MEHIVDPVIPYLKLHLDTALKEVQVLRAANQEKLEAIKTLESNLSELEKRDLNSEKDCIIKELQEKVDVLEKAAEFYSYKDDTIQELLEKVETLEAEAAMSSEKDDRIKMLEENIVVLANHISERDIEIEELNRNIEEISSTSQQSQKLHDKVIVVLKNQCAKLNTQLHGTRQVWLEKCNLIEKYRQELIDVSGQVSWVHDELEDMKAWQKGIETYTKLKSNIPEYCNNQEHCNNQQYCIEGHDATGNTITTAEIKECVQNQKNNQFVKLNNQWEHDMKECGDAPLGCATDVIDRTFYHLNHMIVEQNQVYNQICITSNVDESDSNWLPNPLLCGSIFELIKMRFDSLVDSFVSDDKEVKRNRRKRLIRIGIPATIVCCFVTGTVLSRMICSANGGVLF